METNQTEIAELLIKYREEREQVAEALQNDVNQVLAAVLLWIQHAKIENKLTEDKSFGEAEKNLKIAIDKIRHLHYALS